MSLSPDSEQLRLFSLPQQELPATADVSVQGLLGKEEAHARLEEEFDRAQRSGLPLSTLVGDINALKAVNDELGHVAGDTLIDVVTNSILRLVADNVRIDSDDARPARTLDIVSAGNVNFGAFEVLHNKQEGLTAGRIGGDEFIVISPDTDEVGIRALAERLQETVDTYLAGPYGNACRARGIKVGLSVGTGTLQPDMTKASDLLKVADANLYANKLSQVRPLTEKELDHLQASLAHLHEAGVRPRDLPRYIQWLGAMGLIELAPPIPKSMDTGSNTSA